MQPVTIADIAGMNLSLWGNGPAQFEPDIHLSRFNPDTGHQTGYLIASEVWDNLHDERRYVVLRFSIYRAADGDIEQLEMEQEYFALYESLEEAQEALERIEY